MQANQCKASSRAAFFAAILAALPMAVSAAPAARIDFTVGNVAAINKAGQTRAVVKGAQIEEGETIFTNNGRAQLRFTDGAHVSLQPQSEFRIDQYRFEGKQDGSERVFLSLLKGGLRTITGFVGRTNKKNYQVSTTVATIGIRGTEYTIQYGNSIQGTVGEGEIEVCNGAGCLNVTNGESYYVQSQDIKPVLTTKGTDLPPAPPQNPPTQLVLGDTVDQSGLPVGFAFVGLNTLEFVEGDLCDGRCGGPGSGELIFDEEGQLVSFLGTPVTSTSMGGNDGIVAWGTFQFDSSRLPQAALVDSSALLTPNALIPGEPLVHFVTGLPADIRTIGGSVGVYTLIGSTLVTDFSNNTIGSLSDATLKIDFVSAAVAATMQWKFVDKTTIGTDQLAGNLTGSLTGTSFSLGDTTGAISAVGQIFGPDAIRAGMIYDINGTVLGAAAFQRTSP